MSLYTKMFKLVKECNSPKTSKSEEKIEKSPPENQKQEPIKKPWAELSQKIADAKAEKEPGKAAQILFDSPGRAKKSTR